MVCHRADPDTSILQMPLEEKARRSKLVIDNNGSLEELQSKVMLAVQCSFLTTLFDPPSTNCHEKHQLLTGLLHAVQVQAVSGVLKQHNTFRGLLSSPLGIALALMAVVPNLRRYARLSWHRLWQGRLDFAPIH